MFIGTKRRRLSLKWVNRGQVTEAGRVYQVEPTELRGLAEARLHAKARDERTAGGDHETRRILHELEVRQIELEIQNAEICLARDEVDTTLERYRTLYDFAPVGYLTIDRAGVIRAANLTGANLLGIDRSRLSGRRFGQFVAEEARPACSQFLGKVFSRAAKVACELPLLKAGKLPFFLQIEAVVDASGELCRAVIIDVSVRRRQETDRETLRAGLVARAVKLEKANRELEEANLELEAFNYTVSHDLCSPLTSINGFAQILMRVCGDRLDEESKGHLRKIFASTMRMKKLITALLDFSRVAHLDIRRKNFNMSEIARAVAAELSMTETENRVAFRVAEGITGYGDGALCRILLQNLMGNAWKHAANRSGTVIEFGMTELAGKPVFFVCDNGPGFDMALAGRLFSPFQRLSGVEVAGHGIGLATVKRIVRRHGGRVWAESSPGEGAAFYYTLD